FVPATVLNEPSEPSRNISAQSYFKAWVARDAASKVREQAIKAYDLGQSLEHDLDMSEAKPLSVQANRLDIQTRGDGENVNNSVYLTSRGNLGLGNIETNGKIVVTGVQGNIDVVGVVKSPTSIKLDALGAIHGGGLTLEGGMPTPASGQLIAPDLVMTAGDGIGMDQAVNVQVDRLAAAGGHGGANIQNRNGRTP